MTSANFQNKKDIPNIQQEETVVVTNPFDDSPISRYPSINTNRMTHAMPPRQPYYAPPYALNPLGHHHHRAAFMYNPLQLMGPTVYRADQTMIRSTNPNAPPIFICAICHTEIHENEHCLQCSAGTPLGCKFFYHRRCVGMTEEAFEMLKREEKLAEWFCDVCLNNPGKQITSVIFTNG